MLRVSFWGAIFPPVYLQPGDLWGLAPDEASIVHIRITERHCAVTLVILGDPESVPDFFVVVDSTHKIPVKTALQAEGVSHQRGIIEGNATIKGRARVPRFRMHKHQDGCVIEERVFPLFYKAFGIRDLGKRLSQRRHDLSTCDEAEEKSAEPTPDPSEDPVVET
jgi:hypothetical protein